MASVNKVILVGNLGRDPEIRHAPSGDAICTLSIATTDTWKDKQTGEKRESTEWHRVVFFGKLAEIAGQYLKKGRSIYVEGRLQTRKWQDQNGQERYTTEIRADEMQMLGGRDSGSGGNDGQGDGYNAPQRQNRPAAQQQRDQSAAQDSGGGGLGNYDDDIPFRRIGGGMSHHII